MRSIVQFGEGRHAGSASRATLRFRGPRGRAANAARRESALLIFAEGTRSGIAAGFWLALLWYAAPVFRRETRSDDLASRLRDTAILGVAIPGVLAALDVLTWWTCVALAIGVAVVRTLWHRPRASGFFAGSAPSWRVFPVLAVLANAWPEMTRPLLDGDSLSYHLPNAATWMHAHGIWVTTTRYWWYPGGSELFAAGLYAVSGPYALPACGILAVLLLAMRAYAFALKATLQPFTAAALASALVAAHALQVQVGNLENDVWLTALLLETAWCACYERDALIRTALATSLVKPVGFLFSLVVLAAAKLPVRSIAVASLAFAAWIVRDAVLAPHAVVPIGASRFPNVWTTTVLWHGLEGVTTFTVAAFHDGPAFSLLCCAAIAGLLLSRDTLFRVCALAFAVLFLLEPFGFNAYGPLLSTGQSLRFALPAIVFGYVALFGPLRPAQIPVAFVLCAAAVYEVVRFQAVFAADASTHGVLVILAIAAAAMLVPGKRARRSASGLVAMGSLAYASLLAAVHPAGYYDDELAIAGRHSSLYAWMRMQKPATVVGYLTPVGPIAIVSPGTGVLDGVDDGACALAKANGALLATAIGIDTSAASATHAFAVARGCGRIVYASDAALVVEPR